MSVISETNRAHYDAFVDALVLAVIVAGEEETEKILISLSVAVWSIEQMRSLLVYALIRCAKQEGKP
jgi:glucose uptake protein GlcU